MPVIWLDYNNPSVLSEKMKLNFSNIRFVTDDTPYSPNLITMVSANGLLEGAVGDAAVGSDANNKVLTGTEVNFKVTPNMGYKVSSVTVTEGEKAPVEVTPDADGKFSYTVNDSVVVMANYEIEQYTITYELNGGVNSDENPETYTFLRGVELAAPTKENAEFLGWYSNSSFMGDPVTEIENGMTGNITLYAMWKEKSEPSSSEQSGISGSTSDRKEDSEGGCGSSVVGLGSGLALALVSAATIRRRKRK